MKRARGQGAKPKHGQGQTPGAGAGDLCLHLSLGVQALQVLVTSWHLVTRGEQARELLKAQARELLKAQWQDVGTQGGGAADTQAAGGGGGWSKWQRPSRWQGRRSRLPEPNGVSGGGRDSDAGAWKSLSSATSLLTTCVAYRLPTSFPRWPSPGVSCTYSQDAHPPPQPSTPFSVSQFLRSYETYTVLKAHRSSCHSTANSLPPASAATENSFLSVLPETFYARLRQHCSVLFARSSSSSFCCLSRAA